MKWVIYLILLLIFVGCANDKIKQPIKTINKDNKKSIVFYSKNFIRYPFYKPMILGKGLIYQKLNTLFENLKFEKENNISKNNIKLLVKFTNKTKYKNEFINEARIFAKEKGLGFIEPKSVVKKFALKNEKKGRIKNYDTNKTILIIYFEPLKYYHFKIYLTNKGNIINEIEFDLTQLENDAFNIWRKIYVPYGNKNREIKYKYLILKDVVNNRGRIILNKSFDEDYKICKKYYNNSAIISLYVFEYAVRNGLIKAPLNGIYKEFIVPYKQELFNNRYFNLKDKIKIDNLQSKIVVYNWNDREYELVPKNYNGNNVAFRCMLFKGRK